MSWQDDPVVDSGGWQNDPIVADSPPQKLPAKLNFPGSGVGEAALSLGSSALSTPIAGLAGIVGSALPGPKGQGADWVERTQNALTYEPQTALGKGITSAVAYPFQKLAQGADVAGQKVSDITGSPLLGTAANTAIQSLPLLIGKGASKLPVLPEASPAMLAKRAVNAQTDAAAVAAQDAGYALPPAQVNPTLTNKAVEGFGGKIKTAQTLSEKNQPISNKLIRDTFGLPEEAPLSADSLALVRKTAGTAGYEPVRAAGRVTPGAEYNSALDAVEAPYKKAASDFPKAVQSGVIDAVDSVRVRSFDAGSAVDQIGIMRDKADTAYRGGDKTLGGAYKGIANALEGELERHLSVMGATDALTDFRNARRMIAETYTVQKHLQPNGNIDAKGLGRELERKPLQGNLKTVAEFGKNFPKAAQLPEKIGGVPMSPLDYAMSAGSLGTAIISGHPMAALGAAAPFARAPIRKLLASEGYQNRFVRPPDYGPGLAKTTAAKLLEAQKDPLLQLFEMAQAKRERQPRMGLLGTPSAAYIN